MADAWREIRIFISSTFKDMQAERDHLVRFVFPDLREKLLGRRIHLVEVDLRWGVTADQEAFDLCMLEIENCRPRFMCILGGRYGWVPPPTAVSRAFMDGVRAGASAAGKLGSEQRAILADLYSLDEKQGVYCLQAKPRKQADVDVWTQRTIAAVQIFQMAGLPEVDRSITASEIFHGALDTLDETLFRFFYFRDAAVMESIPEEYAADYREPPGSFAEQALTALKDRISDPNTKGRTLTGPNEIHKVSLSPFVYPCEWDEATNRITGLKTFGAKVSADLLASIDAEFGHTPSVEPSLFVDENALCDAFIATRTERYVIGSRQPVFDKVLDHAEGLGANGYLCVVGEPGSGKSALLGSVYRAYVEGTETRRAHRDDLVIPHFIGVNTSNLRELLRRLCHELVVGASLAHRVPVDFDELQRRFPELLASAAEVRHVVLLIDAVDKLDTTNAGLSMTWLPDHLPDNARVAIASLEGPALDALRRRRKPPVEVRLEALTRSDDIAIVEAFLARYRKELDEQQSTALLGKEDVGKPLYLLTALEELRTLGSYGEISERIRQIPGGIQDLFHWILKRLESDDGFRNACGELIGETLVRDYCSFLAVGRSGMAEAELVDLVQPGDPLGNVAALQRLLRPYLMRRGALLDFFHSQLKGAVESKYLDEDERIAAHRTVADYFRRVANPARNDSWAGGHPRGLSELPYHLTMGEEPQLLYEILTDFRFLEHKVADVGIIEHTDSNGRWTKLYAGAFQLQDDFEFAVSRIVGQHRGTTESLPTCTAVNFGQGLVVRCPRCLRLVPVEAEHLGREFACPRGTCDGRMRLNPFIAGGRYRPRP